ncbi:hypothetical protein PFISCL1PPCAC_16183, partial [Pristionchus fissidentatus]
LIFNTFFRSQSSMETNSSCLSPVGDRINCTADGVGILHIDHFGSELWNIWSFTNESMRTQSFHSSDGLIQESLLIPHNEHIVVLNGEQLGHRSTDLLSSIGVSLFETPVTRA